MSAFAVLLAQLLDPVRVVAMIIAVFLAYRAGDLSFRIVLIVIGIMAVSGIMAVILPTDLGLAFVVGCIANAILAAIIIGIYSAWDRRKA